MSYAVDWWHVADAASEVYTEEGVRIWMADQVFRGAVVKHPVFRHEAGRRIGCWRISTF